MVLAHIRKAGFFDVMRNAGIWGFYHGVEAALYRDISFNMCLFVFRSYYMKWYENNFEDPGMLKAILLELPATTVATIVACPFDVVKTRIQGQHLSKSVVVNSLYQILLCITIFLTGSGSRRPIPLLIQITCQEGIEYLFKGLLPRRIAVSLYMATFLAVNEKMHMYILGAPVIS